MQNKLKPLIFAILAIAMAYIFLFLDPINSPDIFLYIKSFHIISIICWMAGMFYLPRLFVYHSQVETGGEQSNLFKIMEIRLQKYIINPAMILSWISGLWLAYHLYAFSGAWLHMKMFFVFLLTGFHGFLAANRKKFACDMKPLSERAWRLFNEVPTVLLIIIVICVVVKPFS